MILTSIAAAPASLRSSRLSVEPKGWAWQRWELPFLVCTIAASIAVRLIRVTQPFVDSWSWKQLTNAMIARNYYLHGYHFLYPQIDWAGPYPGYIGTEFPLVPFTAALLYNLFGIHEWVGRSLSIAFFAASAPFLYLLVRRISSAGSAAVALGAYCVAPLVLFASRSFQSDMASVGFCVIALYFTCTWLDNPSGRVPFLLAIGTTSLAVATKLPQLSIGVPILYLCWDRYGPGLFRRRDVWVFGILALLLPAAWELQAHHISVTYYPYHFAGENGIRIMDWPFYRHVLWKTFTFSLTPILSVALVAGVVARPQARYGRLFHWWLLAFAVFFIVAGRENRHPWVQMPLIPIAAAFLGLLSGQAVRWASRFAGPRNASLGVGLLLLLPLGYWSYRMVLHPYTPWQEPDYKAALELKRISPPDALILAVEEGEPAIIYYSERKGWHFLEHFGGLPRDSAEGISELEKYIGFGASYIVFDRYELYWLDRYRDFQHHLDSHYTRVSQTPDYLIFELRPPRPTLGSQSEKQPSARSSRLLCTTRSQGSK